MFPWFGVYEFEGRTEERAEQFGIKRRGILDPDMMKSQVLTVGHAPQWSSVTRTSY